MDLSRTISVTFLPDLYQASIEGKLDKKRKSLLGAPAGKKVSIRQFCIVALIKAPPTT